MKTCQGKKLEHKMMGRREWAAAYGHQKARMVARIGILKAESCSQS
jgi:hypothetical protein